MQQQERHIEKHERLWELTKGYKKGYEPNVADGLAKLQSRIAQDKRATSPTIVPIRRWLSRAAAIVLLVLGASTIYQNFVSSPSLISINTQEEVIKAYSLPDGSEVWVNKNSQLSFPPSFEGDQRIIQLEGEAFFKVVADPTKPFIVQTGATEVQVLGTAFNIRAYPQEAITALNVLEGKVDFTVSSTDNQVTVKANEYAQYHNNTQQLSTTPSIEWIDTAWSKSKLTFDNEPLQEIIDYLQSNFQVRVTLGTPSLASCTLTSTLVDNNPDAIINRIKATFPVQVKVLGTDQYQLNGRCQ